MTTIHQDTLTNYVAYRDSQNGRNRIGHYQFSENTIQPLSFIAGTPIDNLYQVIEVGEQNIVPCGDPFSASSINILPPLAERDVLCVGKNYAEHAKEFNSSGFDSSDKVDTPSHPVIFTKRFTSVIADGEEILPHPDFTQTLDYEGEIGVIIGKPGFRICEEDAASHIWGYTIINDVTAREKQRDHKQFFLGKSADTFCPMGPTAIPASKLHKVLRVQTFVNGEARQDATTDDLIFSIPYLIKVISEGQTLMPGDVLATGTPAGVGIGRKPPTYLQPGDTVTISVTGLGTLTNTVASPDSLNQTTSRFPSSSSRLPQSNATSLTLFDNKPLHYRRFGNDSNQHIVFIHGLSGSMESFIPLMLESQIEISHSVHLIDLEGHGLSPTAPLSKLSVDSFTKDINEVFKFANIASNATIVAHSTGCLIAVQFALTYPDKISKLILIGPPPSPLPGAQKSDLFNRAQRVREQGMATIVNLVSSAGTSTHTKAINPLALAAVRLSLLAQNPEGYAKACTAWAEAEHIDFGAIQADTLIIAGSEDKVSPPQLCEWYVTAMGTKARLRVLQDVAQWHIYEDVKGVSDAMQAFLR